MINSVCIFGDSVAKGVVFDAVKNKYRLLKESFANIVERQQNISIFNFARFGCTISMGSEILKRHESELNAFDYTILEFGGNDCDYNWAEISEDPLGQHVCNTPITLFREKYMELIDRVLQNGGRPVLLNLPPIDPKRYFKWVSKGLNGKNILAFLGEVDAIYKWQEMYSTTIEELASKERIPMIDIRSGFMSKKNFSSYLCADGIHPNEKGHLLISRAIREKAFS
ncbi:MAG TPA: SGNH/GDSL hydrolase family protein [Anaerovoracaceae bacterium]|nr:SGNH/GDSL hydrolase family protein [Anaerovoracaceae bacterium]